ncbi:hypothetical protein ACMA5I_08050 [Paracoccaceae bacterium GXU_MW_L88]
MRRVLTAMLVAAPALAAAHPHSYVDQQVQLSLGMDSAQITVVIVPSANEGEAIFAHLDRDGDGAISDAEASAFARAVLDKAALMADGETVKLENAQIAMPEADAIQGGLGPIRLRADAPLALAPDTEHEIAFTIGYEDLSHDWFVQPYYHDDFTAAFPEPGLRRSEDGHEVVITLD